MVFLCPHHLYFCRHFRDHVGGGSCMNSSELTKVKIVLLESLHLLHQKGGDGVKGDDLCTIIQIRMHSPWNNHQFFIIS